MLESSFGTNSILAFSGTICRTFPLTSVFDSFDGKDDPRVKLLSSVQLKVVDTVSCFGLAQEWCAEFIFSVFEQSVSTVFVAMPGLGQFALLHNHLTGSKSSTPRVRACLCRVTRMHSINSILQACSSVHVTWTTELTPPTASCTGGPQNNRCKPPKDRSQSFRVGFPIWLEKTMSLVTTWFFSNQIEKTSQNGKVSFPQEKSTCMTSVDPAELVDNENNSADSYPDLSHKHLSQSSTTDSLTFSSPQILGHFRQHDRINLHEDTILIPDPN